MNPLVEVVRVHATRAMVIGGALFALGGIVTYATYSSAAGAGGGSYFLWWGPMVFGGWRFLKGAWMYATAPNIAARAMREQ